jgi:hypothetical protein
MNKYTQSKDEPKQYKTRLITYRETTFLFLAIIIILLTNIK